MRRSIGNEGFILVSVIWIAGLIAIVASNFAVAVSLHVRGEANLAGSMEAEFAADGLVRLIAFRLASASAAQSRQGAPTDGELVRCSLDGGRSATVAVQDQGGLLDLNRASLQALAALIGKATRSGSDPLSLAEAIADFRDSDDVRLGVTKGGPEEGLVAGGPGMKNAPFQSVDEIEQVIPADMADLHALKRLFTVYSHEDGIDLSAAPAELRSMIDGGGDKLSAAIPIAPSQHKSFAIDAEVAATDGSRFRRSAIVSILREPQRPFAVLEWRQASGFAADQATAPVKGSCEELTFD